MFRTFISYNEFSDSKFALGFHVFVTYGLLETCISEDELSTKIYNHEKKKFFNQPFDTDINRSISNGSNRM